MKYQKLSKTLITSRFHGIYWCAHKTATLTSIQHTVPYAPFFLQSIQVPFSTSLRMNLSAIQLFTFFIKIVGLRLFINQILYENINEKTSPLEVSSKMG